MSELPDYLEDEIIDHVDRKTTCEHEAAAAKSKLRDAIHSYAREREAAALERAAKACEEIGSHGCCDTWCRTGADDCGDCAKAIRSMIHKEPANG